MEVKLPEGENIRIANSDDVALIMQKILRRQNRLYEQREYFWSVGLNGANDIEYIELLTGGKDSIQKMKPLEIFHIAVSKKCEKLILCHNSLTKNVMPTDEDKRITEKIKKGAEVLEMELLDHIIICDQNKVFCSLKSLKMV